MDGLYSETEGREYLIEINDSIGLSPNHQEEDMNLIKDLTLEKMAESISRSSMELKSPPNPTELEKQLEVELINSGNLLRNVQTKLRQAEHTVSLLKNANLEWSRFHARHFQKIIMTSLTFGISFGMLFSYVLLSWRQRN